MALANIPCFWIEPAGRVARYLRRSSPVVYDENRLSVAVCQGFAFHDARVKIDELPSTNDLECPNRLNGDIHDHADPRYPTRCDRCGYEFTPADDFCLNARDIYRRPDTGGERARDAWGPGAMFHAGWMASFEHVRPVDGVCLMIILPDTLGRVRHWCVDVPPSMGGPGATPWTRTGDPRRPETLTVRPSILLPNPPRFHAILTHGVLELCPDTVAWE